MSAGHRIALILSILLIPFAAVAEEVVLQPSGAAGKDTWAGAEMPTTGHGSDTYMRFGGYAGTSENRLYIQFDLSGLAGMTAVETARIEIYMNSQNGFIYGYNYGVYPVTAAWSEAGVTWNNQPACAATPVYTISGNDWQADIGQWKVIPDLAGLVQSWLDDPSSNFGVVIKPTGGFYGYVQFWTSDYGTANMRPKLVVTGPMVDVAGETWGEVKSLFR